MKTTKFFLMAALALTFAACSNDDNDILNPAQPAKAEGITITATLAPKDAGATTRAVSEGTGEDAGNIVASWAAKEHIAILYEKDGTKYAADAEIKSVDASGTATIEFTVESGTADNTACTLVYPYSAAKDDKSGVKDAATLLASQDGTLNANLDVRVGAGTIRTTTPSLDVTTQPEAQFAIFKFTVKNSDALATIDVKPLTVTIGDAGLCHHPRLGNLRTLCCPACHFLSARHFLRYGQRQQVLHLFQVPCDLRWRQILPEHAEDAGRHHRDVVPPFYG